MKREKITRLLLLVCMLTVLFSVNTWAAKIKISNKTLTLTEGQTAKLKVKGTKASVKWSSTNKKVVKVKKGKVTAVAAGKATIKAKVSGKTLQCKVTVQKKPAPVVTPKINKTALSIPVAGTEQLSVSDASKVTWKSSNAAVADVSSAGLITAHKLGTCTVTGTADGKAYNCAVTVTERKIKTWPAKLPATFNATYNGGAAIKVVLTKLNFSLIQSADEADYNNLNGDSYSPYQYRFEIEGYVPDYDQTSILSFYWIAGQNGFNTYEFYWTNMSGDPLISWDDKCKPSADGSFSAKGTIKTISMYDMFALYDMYKNN